MTQEAEIEYENK